MAAKENRNYPRVPAYWGVTAVDKNKREFIGQCKNVSLRGLLVIFNENFKVGERFKLLIRAMVSDKAIVITFVVEVTHTALLVSSSNYSIGMKIISDISNGKPFLKTYIQDQSGAKKRHKTARKIT